MNFQVICVANFPIYMYMIPIITGSVVQMCFYGVIPSLRRLTVRCIGTRCKEDRRQIPVKAEQRYENRVKMINKVFGFIERYSENAYNVI